MGVRASGPQGFASNWQALLELLRFGFGVWGPARMAVLLFHVERATAYGWASDCHSRAQATDGVYSRDFRRWIRGPVGVSPATWHRENAALVKAGVLRREKRKTGRGGYAPTEYAPDWLGIRAAIDAWKEATAPAEALPLLVTREATPLSQGETRASLMVRPPLSQGETRASLMVRHTEVSSSGCTEVSECADSLTGASALQVREALESAWGAALPEGDTVPGELVAIAGRLGLPIRALCVWVQNFAAGKSAAGYAITSPRLFVRAAARDLIPWARGNRHVIEAAECEERAAAWRGGDVAAMPAAVVATVCPKCGEEAVVDEVCHGERCTRERAASSRVAAVR